MRVNHAATSLKTLGLAGDGDEVDLLETVEQSFGIQLEDDECMRVRTVGDLFDLAFARMGEDNTARDGRGCATAIAFYRLRRAIGADAATPKSELARITDMSPSKFLRHVEHETGLLIRGSSEGLVTTVGFYSALFALLCVIWFARSADWSNLIVATGVLSAAIAVIWFDGRRWHGETLGDLARNVAALNIFRLSMAGAGTTQRDVWHSYLALLSIETGADARRITRDTRFI